MLKDTIVAIATPLAMGAISIIRMSGDEAIEIADKLCSRSLINVDSHTVTYAHIKDPVSSEIVDEVLINVFRAPKTYTREDIVEINCHGGVYVTKHILELCYSLGARPANPGEFTQRAFLNGRIDLTQAEAVNDLIEARHGVGAKLAIDGVKGSVKKLIDPLVEQILDLIANIEVNIDYPEYEDIEMITSDILLPNIEDWLTKIDHILETSMQSQLMREGIATAIIGQPNAGKSSLLNALLEEDKAIVTDIAGTTRDIVEGQVHFKGYTLNLVDTAGIRETEDKIEQLGIQRSRKAIDDAQLVILVVDASVGENAEDEKLWELASGKERIKVYNKSDLKRVDGINISASNNEIESLLDEIASRYEENKLSIAQPTLANERQIGWMRKAKLQMLQAKEALESGIELDMVEIDIQAAYTSLKEILGEVHRDDLLDTLFSKFCLGK